MGFLAELQLDEVVDHLVEDRGGVEGLWHVTQLVGHVQKVVPQLPHVLLLLQIFPEVLFAVFD